MRTKPAPAGTRPKRIAGHSTAGARSLLPLLLLCALPAAVQAQFEYTVSDGTVTITRYSGPGGTVTIPDTLEGHPVSRIGDLAFKGCTSLTDVTVPDSVTSIGDQVFKGCTALTSVEIGNGVTTIPGRSFGCMDVDCFWSGLGMFEGCTSLTNVTIPDSVRSIGGYAFYGCTRLASVIIPDSVRSIGGYAFYGCTRLASVIIPASVTSVGEGAFWACTSLNSLVVDTLNAGYSSLDGVLFDKNQTVLIQFPGGKAGAWVIPNSVTSTGEGAFSDCTGLTSITIPDSVTTIPGGSWRITPWGSIRDGLGMFEGCTSLTNVTIPDSVRSIGGYAFYGCTRLTSVIIPNSVTSIGSSAFADCTRLTDVKIGNGVTGIAGRTLLCERHCGWLGLGMFEGCTSLTNLTIPDSVRSIEAYAFSGSGLTSVVIPDSVTYIGEGVFKGCTRLASVEIGKGVTAISEPLVDCRSAGMCYWTGSGVFQGCTSLTNITISDSVRGIGAYAFSGCGSLVAVHFEGNAPGLPAPLPWADPDVFKGANKVTCYYLPGSPNWGATFGGRPTALWQPEVASNDSSFGFRTNRFGFTISWAGNRTVVVEACAGLSNPTWSPVSTHILADGSSYFSDPQWADYPARFYRVRAR